MAQHWHSSVNENNLYIQKLFNDLSILKLNCEEKKLCGIKLNTDVHSSSIK